MPSTMPPTGRMKKPTPKVATASSSELEFVAGREEQLRDYHREEAVDGEVEPFEPVAEHGGDNGSPPLLCERFDGYGRVR